MPESLFPKTQKHWFVSSHKTDEEAQGIYRCKYCGWGTRFPEMYETEQDWRDQPTASPLRIVGGLHGCWWGSQGIGPG